MDAKKLKPHDGITEWSVCRSCGTRIDWTQIPRVPREEDDVHYTVPDTRCPNCGSSDTAWLEA